MLSHSRKAYSEALFRQSTDDFLRCLENAFRHFGGVPKTLVIDNLKAAVSKADGSTMLLRRPAHEKTLRAYVPLCLGACLSASFGSAEHRGVFR